MWYESNILVNGLRVPAMTFPGGEINVRIPLQATDRDNFVGAVLKTPADLITLALVADALRRMHCRKIRLVAPYMPYARQDRVVNQGEALSIAVASSMINMLGFDYVEIWDPHSDVTPALISNVVIRPQTDFLAEVFNRDDAWDCIVSPDAGAEKKVLVSSIALGTPFVRCAKTRDPMTGAISGAEVVSGDVDGKRCLIVDDICDGGATFIALAKALRDRGAARVDLFVTHGIFSRGFEPFVGVIDRVYFTNSLLQSPDKTFAAINFWEHRQ